MDYRKFLLLQKVALGIHGYTHLGRWETPPLSFLSLLASRSCLSRICGNLLNALDTAAMLRLTLQPSYGRLKVERRFSSVVRKREFFLLRNTRIYRTEKRCEYFSREFVLYDT